MHFILYIIWAAMIAILDWHITDTPAVLPKRTRCYFRQRSRRRYSMFNAIRYWRRWADIIEKSWLPLARYWELALIFREHFHYVLGNATAAFRFWRGRFHLLRWRWFHMRCHTSPTHRRPQYAFAFWISSAMPPRLIVQKCLLHAHRCSGIWYFFLWFYFDDDILPRWR